jgi:hypothetical protein
VGANRYQNYVEYTRPHMLPLPAYLLKRNDGFCPLVFR